MGLLLAIEIIKIWFVPFQVFIPSTWRQENMAVYYKALVEQRVLCTIFPDKHYQFKWKKNEEKKGYVFFVFFC